MKDTPKVWTATEFLGHAFPTNQELVKGLIAQTDLVLCSAPAKTGKSLLAAQLAIAVATGRYKFLGHFETQKSRVLLVQTEISNQRFQERLLKTIDLNDFPFDKSLLICGHRFKIDTAEGRASLQAVVSDTKPELLILDPFYTLHSRDEDKAKDIAPILSWLKQLAITNNAAIFLIHHQGKKGEGSSGKQVGHQHRGSSSFADVPDASLSLKPCSEPKKATLNFELRNYEAPAALQLNLLDNLTWQVVGEASEFEENTITINKVFGEATTLSRQDITTKIQEKFSKGNRTADRRIAEWVQKGEIQKRPVGNNTWFDRVDTRQPLRECQFVE